MLWVEVGSVAHTVAAKVETKEQVVKANTETVSLPGTLKQPLNETPTNFEKEKQVREERRLYPKLEQPVKVSLPPEIQKDVIGYFRNGYEEVYKDDWLTVRRFGSKEDGLVGVYTDNEGFMPGKFSHVTFDVKEGKLVHMQVNSKELFPRMLKNRLPKELKYAMDLVKDKVE